MRDEKHRKGRSGCVQILDPKVCQAQKAENTDSRTNYAVKYATARGNLILARTATRKRFPLSTVYECVSRHFFDTRVFKTHRHAVYQCLIEASDMHFFDTLAFLKRAFRHARLSSCFS